MPIIPLPIISLHNNITVTHNSYLDAQTPACVIVIEENKETYYCNFQAVLASKGRGE